MEGWIKLHRSLLNHRLFRDGEAYDKKSAFIYLLLRANHREAIAEIEGHDFQVQRGSMVTSIRKLADVWKWSRSKVDAFLDDCVLNGELKVERLKRMTVVHVSNYEKYQGNLIEIQFKQEPTFRPTLEPTKKADLKLVNTRDSEQLGADLESQLESQLIGTNNKRDKENKDILSEIIAFLNEQAGTKYKANVQKTQGHVYARLKEGFALDDFKSVIIAKVAEWKDDAYMSKFIRPETLFGTKFEGYLNTALAMEKKSQQEARPLPMFTLSDEEREYYESLSK